jgi:hypothetical protein
MDSTVGTIIYPELFGEDFNVGVQFESPDGAIRRAVCSGIQIHARHIAVGWCLQTQITELDGSLVWKDSSLSTPALLVTENTFRQLADGRVVPTTEATEEDGSVKPGYLSEYKFFRVYFGLDNVQPKGIFWYIATAICDRINATYPELNLTLQ